MSCSPDVSWWHLFLCSYLHLCGTLETRQLRRCVAARGRPLSCSVVTNILWRTVGDRYVSPSAGNRNDSGSNTKPWSCSEKVKDRSLRWNFTSCPLEPSNACSRAGIPPAAADGETSTAAPPWVPHLAPSLTHDAPCQREHMWRWRWQLLKNYFTERERERT